MILEQGQDNKDDKDDKKSKKMGRQEVTRAALAMCTLVLPGRAEFYLVVNVGLLLPGNRNANHSLHITFLLWQHMEP